MKTTLETSEEQVPTLSKFTVCQNNFFVAGSFGSLSSAAGGVFGAFGATPRGRVLGGGGAGPRRAAMALPALRRVGGTGVEGPSLETTDGIELNK